jgi:hypothetical protein
MGRRKVVEETSESYRNVVCTSRLGRGKLVEKIRRSSPSSSLNLNTEVTLFSANGRWGIKNLLLKPPHPCGNAEVNHPVRVERRQSKGHRCTVYLQCEPRGISFN